LKKFFKNILENNSIKKFVKEKQVFYSCF